MVYSSGAVPANVMYKKYNAFKTKYCETLPTFLGMYVITTYIATLVYLWSKISLNRTPPNTKIGHPT